MNVHDHITDWQHLPSSFLAGKRAIATTVEGTTIDGFLQSMTTKFSNGVRVQNDSKLIDYLDDGWKIINVTAANPLALDNEAVVLYVIEKEKKLEQTE